VAGADWSLVLFTLLMQAAVGAFVTVGFLSWPLPRSLDRAAIDDICRTPLVAAAAIFATGVAVAFGHLGSPMNAAYALANLGSSWLSRELLFVVLFAGTGGLVVALHWQGRGAPFVRRLAVILGAASGFALVYSMTRVYMLDTVPSWNRLATAGSFFAAAALLGVVIVAASLAPDRSDGQQVDGIRRTLMVVALALIGPRLLAVIAIAAPVESVAAAFEAPAVPTWALLLQALLLVTAAALLGRSLISFASGRPRVVLVIASAALVLASEILGRFLFFGSYWRIGV
jgi:anaerobic dimethyl sulfoxide reductase subunit C (anchor subunit)